MCHFVVIINLLFDMYVVLRIAVEREARVASDDARRSASASDGHKPSTRLAPFVAIWIQHPLWRCRPPPPLGGPAMVPAAAAPSVPAVVVLECCAWKAVSDDALLTVDACSAGAACLHQQ
jgi:hypothetical protein